MRLFVAIPLEGETHQLVAGLLPELKRRLPSCRWVKPENLHLTLRFLGEVPEAALPEVRGWFQQAVATVKFGPLELEGTGSFKHRERMVFWCGVRAADFLLPLADRLSGPVAGVPAEPRPFAPHLTLGRYRIAAREQRQLAAFQEYFAALRLPQTRQTTVRLVLFESRLSPAGATYHEVLASGPAGE